MVWPRQGDASYSKTTDYACTQSLTVTGDENKKHEPLKGVSFFGRDLCMHCQSCFCPSTVNGDERTRCHTQKQAGSDHIHMIYAVVRNNEPCCGEALGLGYAFLLARAMCRSSEDHAEVQSLGKHRARPSCPKVMSQAKDRFGDRRSSGRTRPCT